MKAFRPFLAAVSMLALVPGMAAAASSDWYQTQGGRVRLVVLPEEADGRIPALLEVRLEPGWKTYWRDPGESGIPPSISFPPATGVTLEAIRFPLPTHFDDGYSSYAGYDHSVAFPLTLRRQADGAEAGQLAASVFLGICKDICIPVQTELSVNLAAPAGNGPGEKAILAAANAALPKPPSPAFAVTDAQWSSDRKTLTVAFTAPDPAGSGKPPQVFVSGPDGFQFGSGAVPLRVGEGYRVEVPLLHKPKAAKLEDARIFFTAESGGQAMETPLAID